MSRLASTPLRSATPQPQTPSVKPSRVPAMPSITNPSTNAESPRRMSDIGPIGVLVLAPSPTPVPLEKGRHHPMPPTDAAHDPLRRLARQRLPPKNTPRKSDQEKRYSVKKDLPKEQTESLSGCRAPSSKRIVETMECFPSTAVKSAGSDTGGSSTFSSPCLQAAAEYNYEGEDYEVDLEIFAIDPGGKLPPLMAGPMPFSPGLEYSRQGYHEEPSVTSSSVSRPHIERSVSAVTAGTEIILDQIVSGFQSREGSNSYSKGALKASLLVPLVIEDSPYNLHSGCSSDGLSVIPVVLDSGPATGTYSYSNEVFEEEDFSYGSLGTWGKYVDEDVDVDGGESYDFDDDENNNCDNDDAHGQGGNMNVIDVTTSTPAYSCPPSKESGMELGSVPDPGDRVHRYGKSDYTDFDTSTETTVSLNPAALRYIVRNLEEAVEYQEISTTS